MPMSESNCEERIKGSLFSSLFSLRDMLFDCDDFTNSMLLYKNSINTKSLDEYHLQCLFVHAFASFIGLALGDFCRLH